jgi:hypothetical protein
MEHVATNVEYWGYLRNSMPLFSGLAAFLLGKFYEALKNAKDMNKKIGTDLVIYLYQMKFQSEQINRLKNALITANSYYDNALAEYKNIFEEIKKDPANGRTLRLEDFCSVNLHVVIKIFELPPSLLKVVTYDQGIISKFLDLENRLTGILLKLTRRDALQQQIPSASHSFGPFQSKMQEVKNLNDVLIKECDGVVPIIQKLEKSIGAFVENSKNIKKYVSEELRSYNV